MNVEQWNGRPHSSNYSPQLDVLAMNDGEAVRVRASNPMSGAPSDPLNDDPEPDTQRYFVDTVCERSLWKSDTVEP